MLLSTSFNSIILNFSNLLVNSGNQSKADFFDAQADASWAASEYTNEERAKIEQVLDCLPELQGCTVLEPGCGTGRLTRILTDKVGPEGLVLALDISPKMIASAKSRLHGLNNVELACVPLEGISLPDSAVDLIFCHQVFPHFDQKKTAISLMNKWLRPGGKLVVFHLINIEEINDLHRKSGTAVAEDIMPSWEEMRSLFHSAELEIESLDDQSDRYFLLASKV
jgi:ubiquinone/menaquinone biosynthesis C-methylase UbiE